MKNKTRKSRNFKEIFMKSIFLLAASVSIFAIIIICLFLFANGIPAMKKIGFGKFLFGTMWQPGNNIYGIFPMIVGSIYVTAGALIVGVPIGILTAAYMARFCPRPIYRILKPATRLLAGIPSVVYGLFGITCLVPFIRNVTGVTNGFTILTTAILLGIMILPTIIETSEAAIRAVPESYYEASIGLGCTKEKTLFKVVIPAAKSGIFAGVVLGLGRALGETMAVVMVCGGQAKMPKSILEGCRTLTSNIVLEMGYASGLHRDALIATAVILFIFALIINLAFTLIQNGKREK